MKSLIKVTLFIFVLYGNIYSEHNYREALYLSTYFYGAQRCGDTQSWCHGACHVKDGQAQGLDLTGGWHDCGDHILFGQTAPYSAGILLEGYLAFPSSYEDRYSPAYSSPPANGIPDVLDEVKIMTDWLIKACQGTTRFYFQKGHSADHNHMSEPRDQSLTYNVSEGGEKDGSRNVYSVTQGGANVAGCAAAALALMAIAYQPYDSNYATTCFNTAKNYITIAERALGTVGGQTCCYIAANYSDDMAWGCASIYKASVALGSPESNYLTKAENYEGSGDWQGTGQWALCYDHTEDVAAYSLYKITGNTTYRNRLASQYTYYNGKMVTCGIGQYSFLTEWGSLRYAANMAFSMALYYDIMSTKDSNVFNFIKKNIDFILGTHGDISGSPGCPEGRSFLIGYTNPDYSSQGSVQHPHHRAAFGKTAAENADQLWQQENNNPGSVPYKYILKGALVGGPRSSCGNYNDKIDDYVANEVGIDYNAGLTGAISALIYFLNPPTPTNTPTNTITPTPNSSWTKTFTPTVTNTPTNTPIPPPTHKLNFEVMNSSGNGSCSEQGIKWKVKITNWDNVAIPIESITIRVWLNTTKTITVEKYDARVRNASDVDQGTITTVTGTEVNIGSTCNYSGRLANKYIIVSFSGGPDIPANGGYLYMDGIVRTSDWSQLDPECDDYTRLLSSWTGYTNESSYTLYEGTNLVCEYIDSTTLDTNTGINPCTSGTGCPGAETQTYTLTFTRTSTPTSTRTNTITNTVTFTRTNTPVNTATFTRTNTSTFTATYTFTPTDTTQPTNTQTGTLTFTPTSISTSTNTYIPSNTLTNTMTDTRTNTATSTFTNTISQTFTFTNTITITWTPTSTNTQTSTVTSTNTGTRTATRTSTDTFTITKTSTETHTPTETVTGSQPPTWTPTDTSTNTATSTMTYTDTFTFTKTITFTQTVTLTETPTQTYSFTQTITNTEIPTNTSIFTATGTATASYTSSQTTTFTETHTATQMITETFTLTPTPTKTLTLTDTYTFTMTISFTPIHTSTYTFTPTFTITSTIVTFTPTATEKLEFKDNIIVYPNPFSKNQDIIIKFYLTKKPENIKIKIYTSSLRLIKNIDRDYDLKQGINEIFISRKYFSELAGGIYYYMIYAKDAKNNEIKSKVNKMIILY